MTRLTAAARFPPALGGAPCPDPLPGALTVLSSWSLSLDCPQDGCSWGSRAPPDGRHHTSQPTLPGVSGAGAKAYLSTNGAPGWAAQGRQVPSASCPAVLAGLGCEEPPVSHTVRPSHPSSASFHPHPQAPPAPTTRTGTYHLCHRHACHGCPSMWKTVNGHRLPRPCAMSVVTTRPLGSWTFGGCLTHPPSQGTLGYVEQSGSKEV